MFFMPKETKSIDAYTQLKQLTYELLRHECPQHISSHHILMTANMKLERLNEVKVYIHKQNYISQSLQQFSIQKGAVLEDQISWLHLFTTSYTQLCDETKRAHFNHALLLHQHTIEECFEFFQNRILHKDIIPLDDDFWRALKQAIQPALQILLS